MDVLRHSQGLSPDEILTLAHQINNLQELERVRKQLEVELEREPNEREWAKAASIPLEELSYRLSIGNQAKETMILSNLRLVRWCARKHQITGLQFKDLFQEGVLGLIRAVEKFDTSLGYRFSTYACYWIRQAIRRAIDKHSRFVYLFNHIQEKSSQLQKRTELTSLISLDSLDIESIESETITPEDFVSLHYLRNTLEKALNILSPHERDILQLRFGFSGTRKSLAQIGCILNISSYKVREVESNALRKLRRFIFKFFDAYDLDDFLYLSSLQQRVSFVDISYLEGIKLSRANLQDKRFVGADLEDNYLVGADLQDIDLSEANLKNADLSKANLRGAYLYLTNLSRANLQNADLSNACLWKANLTKADLQSANLSGADLQGANLSGANLQNAYLSGAILYETKLTSTIMPDGWIPVLPVSVPVPPEVHKLSALVKPEYTAEDSNILARFIMKLSDSNRSLISFCIQEGKIEVYQSLDASFGLLIVCPNLIIQKRLKSRIQTLTNHFKQVAGNYSLITLSCIDNPIKALDWESWNSGWIVDKVFPKDLNIYSQMKHLIFNWVLVLPISMIDESL